MAWYRCAKSHSLFTYPCRVQAISVRFGELCTRVRSIWNRHASVNAQLMQSDYTLSAPETGTLVSNHVARGYIAVRRLNLEGLVSHKNVL